MWLGLEGIAIGKCLQEKTLDPLLQDVGSSSPDYRGSPELPCFRLLGAMTLVKTFMSEFYVVFQLPGAEKLAVASRGKGTQNIRLTVEYFLSNPGCLGALLCQCNPAWS